MKPSRFRCPHCESKFTVKLPAKCPFCKKAIPEKETTQLAFIAMLDDGLLDFYQTGMLDNDFYVSLRSLCKEKSQRLHQTIVDSMREAEAAERAARATPAPLPEKPEKVTLGAPVQKKETQEHRLVLSMDPIEGKPKEEAVPSEKTEGVLTPGEIRDVLKEIATMEESKIPESAPVETQAPPEKAASVSSVLADYLVKAEENQKAFQAQRSVQEGLVEKKPHEGPKAPDRAEAPLPKKKKPSRAFPSFVKPKAKEKNPLLSKKPAAPKEEKKSAWAAYLMHPAVKENILLFLGIFLILAGEVFVVSNAWSRLSGSMRLIGIFCLILSSVLLFFFLGRFISRRLKLDSAAAVMYFLTLLLYPLVMIVPTQLLEKNLPLGIATALAGLLCGVFVAKTTGDFFKPSLFKPLLAFFLPLALLHLATPFSIASFPVGWTIFAYVPCLLIVGSWGIVVRTTSRILLPAPDAPSSQTPTIQETHGIPAEQTPALQETPGVPAEMSETKSPPSESPALEIAPAAAKMPEKSPDTPSLKASPAWMAVSLTAFLSLLLHIHYHFRIAGIAVPNVFAYAPMLSLFAMFLAWLAYTTPKKTFSAPGIASVCLTVVAVSMGTGHLYLLLLTLVFALVLFGYHTRHSQSTYFFLAALLCSILVYFLLPAPVRTLVLEVRAWLGGKLGYAQGRLPFSYYGITFLPYMIGLCWLGNFLYRKDLPHLGKAVGGWFLTLSVGLLALVKFGGNDIRPVLWTLPIYGAGYLVAIRYLRLPLLSYFSVGTVSLWLYEVSVHLFPQAWTGGCTSVVLALLWMAGGICAKFFPRSDYAQQTLFYFSLFLGFLGTGLLASFVAQWPPSMPVSLFLLLAGFFWALAVPVFQRRWMWGLFFASCTTGIVALLFSIYPGQWQLIASANILWAYSLTASGIALSFFPFLPKVCDFLAMPGLEKKSPFDWLVIRPLGMMSVVPLVVATAFLLDMGFFRAPDLFTVCVVLSTSFYGAICVRFYRLPSSCSALAQLPWVLVAVPLLMYRTMPLSIAVFTCATLYLATALALRDRLSIWTSLTAMIVSSYLLLCAHFVAPENILLVYASTGLALAGAQQILLSRKWMSEAFAFEFYSFLLALLVITGILGRGLENRLSPDLMGYCLAIEGTVFLVHALNRGWALLTVPAFVLFSAAFCTGAHLYLKFNTPPGETMEGFWKHNLAVAYGVLFVAWGASLYFLRHAVFRWKLLSVLTARLARSRGFKYCLLVYPSVAFLCAYLLGTELTFFRRAIEPLPVSILLSCVAYAFLYGLIEKASPAIYVSALVLNQSMLTIYFMQPASRIVHEWPLVQAMVCLSFALAAWMISRKSYFEMAARALYQYSSVTLMATLSYLLLWRLGMAFHLYAFPEALPIYSRTCLLTAVLFLAFRFKVHWAWLPYAALSAIAGSFVFGLDIVSAEPVFYSIALVSLALAYGALPVCFNSLRSPLDRMSVLLSSANVCYAVYLYLSHPTQGTGWMFLLGTLLTLHAFFYFIRTSGISWAYLGAIYGYASVYFNGIARADIPWYGHPLAMGCTVLLALLLLYFFQFRKFHVVYRKIRFDFSGPSLARALHDVSSAVAGLCLLFLFFLWVILMRYPSMPLANGIVPGELYDRPLLLALTLLLYAAAWLWMRKSARDSARPMIRYALIFTITLFLLFFPYFTQWLDRCPNQLVFATSELAIYSFLLAVCKYRFGFHKLVLYILPYACMAGVGAAYHYPNLSSVISVPFLGLVPLFLFEIKDRQEVSPGYALHVVLFAVALFHSGYYLLSLPAVTWQGDMVCTGLILLATFWTKRELFARFAFGEKMAVEKDGLENGLFTHLARFFLYFGLYILILQGYRYPAGPGPYQIATVGLCVAISAWLLFRMGEQEEFPLSHYVLQALGPLMYLFLRFRMGFFASLDGYDLPMAFALFVFLPNVAAIWMSGPKLPRVMSDFSFLTALGILVLENRNGFDIVPTSMYLALVSFLLILRNLLGEEEKEEKLSADGQNLSAVFSFISVFLGCLTYLTQSSLPSWWLPVISVVFMAQAIFFYLLTAQGYAAFLSFFFFTLAAYSTMAIYWPLAGAAHPIYLLALSNLLLTIGGVKTKEIKLGTRLSLDVEQASEVGARFSSLLMLGILVGSGTLLLCEILDLENTHLFSLSLSREALSSVIAENYLLIWATILVSGWTAVRLQRKFPSPWPLFSSVFIGLGLTTPLGHLASGVSLSRYCVPSLDWAVLSLLVFLYIHRVMKNWSLKFFDISKSFPLWENVSFVIALSAIATTQLNTTSPLTFSTLLATSFLWLLFALTRKSAGWFRLHSVNLLISVYFFIFYLLPRTGKPVSLVFPLLSLSTALIAFAFIGAAFRAERKEKTVIPNLPRELDYLSSFFLVVAILFVGAAVFMVGPDTAGVGKESYFIHTFLSALSLSLCIAISLAMGKRTGKMPFYLAFQGLIASLFYFLRVRTSWLSFVEGYDPHVLIVLAVTFFQIYMHLERPVSSKASGAFKIGAYWLPLFVILYSPWDFEKVGSSLYALAAAHFGVIYRATLQKCAMLVALAMLNLALFQFWRAQAIVDPQFYGIPLGLTLLALAELNKKQMEGGSLVSLRMIGLLCIYGSSAVQVLLKIGDPTYTVALGIFALIGVVIGVVLKNNLYLYLASVFLVADVLGYFVKYGLEHGILEGMLLVMAGLGVLASALYFHFKRSKGMKEDAQE